MCYSMWEIDSDLVTGPPCIPPSPTSQLYFFPSQAGKIHTQPFATLMIKF